MAKNVISTDAPIPFKAIEEANDENLIVESHPQTYDNLIDSLPVKSYNPGTLRLYKGFWVWEMILRGTFTMQQKFQSRPTDIFIASSPKSGSTWLKALIFAIMTRSTIPLHRNPLLAYNPHQCIPNIDNEFAEGRSSLIEILPSPRLLSTHLPYSLLPDSIAHSDCPIIYICRDPKDVSVSMYHALSLFFKDAECKPSFSEIFEMLCDGVSGYGPLWNHVFDYWQEHVKRPRKVFFLKYEDLLQEQAQYVERLAEFINRPFSDEERKDGLVEQIVELCSFKKLKDLKVNNTDEWSFHNKVTNSDFFRKGAIGDWVNHMTPEMAQKLDDIVEQKFKDSGLEIRAMSSKLASSSVE